MPTILRLPGAAPSGVQYPGWASSLRSHWDGVQIVATSLAPTSIPHDGSNVGASLQNWIDNLPSGSDAGHIRRYDLRPLAGMVKLNDVGMDFRGKSFFQVYAPGTDWQVAGDGSSNAQSFCLFGNGQEQQFEGLGTCRVDGLNGYTATINAQLGVNERLNAFLIRGKSSYVKVAGIVWDNVRGFGPGTYGDDGSSTADAPKDVWISDMSVRGAEMGLVVTSGRRVLFEDIDVLDSCDNGMDIEPDEAYHVVEDILCRDIRIGKYGWGQSLSSWMFSSVPSGGAEAVPMDRVTLEDWTSVGSATFNNGNIDGIGGLAIRCDDPNAKTDYVFRRLVTAYQHQRGDAVMRFNNVHGPTGLVVQDCVQPRASGSLVSATSCSPTSFTGNTPP